MLTPGIAHRWGVAQGSKWLGGMISPSQGRAKMERGQHLPPLQKQNKPSGREQLRAWRPSKRGGSCLKTGPAPAATTHPRLPRLIGGFESCRPPPPPFRAFGRVLVCRVVSPGGGGGKEWKGGGEPRSSPCCSKIFPDCSLGSRVLGGPGAAAGKKRRWPRRTARSFLLSPGSGPWHRGGPGHPVRAEG